jgi:hypothetical protein
MATPFSRRYNGIHRQQLFHWLGSHIDRTIPAETVAQRNRRRTAYVECLKSAVKDGIWLKTPRKPDQLGDGSLIKVSRPIACFTEWSLGQSLAHTSEYGQLGLGFSKRFILSRGGQPVIYVQDKKSSAPYSAALKALAAALKDPATKIPATQRQRLWQHFDFIAHFAKVIQKPPRPRKSTPPKPSGFFPSTFAALKGLKTLMAEEVEKAFSRKYGRILHYLEEREWRIVYDQTLEKYFDEGPATAGGPEHFLPFEPGNELFTVVLPDNLTVALALRDHWLRNKLFPKDGPHVTLLSFQDIGTF